MQKKDIDEIVLVGGSTRIPKIQQLVKDFFCGKVPFRGININEAVAYGAAIHAGDLFGQQQSEAILLDVIPLTLGIESVGGFMTTLIPRNTIIPAKATHIISTDFDNQSTVTIFVYEGERAMTKDNHFLGKFDLTGIPPAPRGVAQIEVSFEIDANGILQVLAEDKNTGNNEKTVIRHDQNTLTSEDIEKMVKDAEKFKDEDLELKKRTETINDLENCAYWLKSQLQDELCTILSGNEKSKIKEAVDEKIKLIEDKRDVNSEDCKKPKDEL